MSRPGVASAGAGGAIEERPARFVALPCLDSGGTKVWGRSTRAGWDRAQRAGGERSRTTRAGWDRAQRAGGERSRTVWLVVGVAALAFAAAAFDGNSGLRNWWTLRTDLRDARLRIGELRRAVAELEQEAAVLEGDPFAVERAIRERLEYARPGETLVRLPGPDDANPRIP